MYGEVEEYRNGTYSITLTPQTTGPHHLHGRHNGLSKYAEQPSCP